MIGDRYGFHEVESESDLVGPAKQPEWTARRAFAETDVYVIPSGEIEFNQYYISSHSRHGKPENLFESELELGLPWRTQFDVEMNYSLKESGLEYDSTLIEIPHALADWGKIPLNPTIDAGWSFNQGESDAYILRLLLAEEFGKRLHFGANLAFQRQIEGELETDYELNVAMNYVAIERKLALGAELLVEYETSRDEEESGNTYSTSVMLGPSVLFRPSSSTYLSLVPLFGLTQDAPVLEAFIFFGIDFEPFGSRYPNEQESGKDSRDFQPVRRPR